MKRTSTDICISKNGPCAIYTLIGCTAISSKIVAPVKKEKISVLTAQNNRWTEPKTGMAFIKIPGKCFNMGSPDSEKNRGSDEKQHEVCVKDFWMGKTEVTQAQWQKVMGNNPSSFKGDNKPVENISWNDTRDFLKKLKTRSGKASRLPSEAEWEYAARAGTSTPFNTGNCISSEQANYNGDYPYTDCPKGQYREQTMDVAAFPANDFGLFDMHGNVWEWTCSAYDKNYNGKESRCADRAEDYVLRGGSWYYDAKNLRSALRNWYAPDYRNYDVGFRVVYSE